jgi:hypothetical protein
MFWFGVMAGAVAVLAVLTLLAIIFEDKFKE